MRLLRLSSRYLRAVPLGKHHPPTTQRICPTYRVTNRIRNIFVLKAKNNSSWEFLLSSYNGSRNTLLKSKLVVRQLLDDRNQKETRLKRNPSKRSQTVENLSFWCFLCSSPSKAVEHQHHSQLTARIVIDKDPLFIWWPSAGPPPVGGVLWVILSTANHRHNHVHLYYSIDNSITNSNPTTDNNHSDSYGVLWNNSTFRQHLASAVSSLDALELVPVLWLFVRKAIWRPLSRWP